MKMIIFLLGAYSLCFAVGTNNGNNFQTRPIDFSPTQSATHNTPCGTGFCRTADLLCYQPTQTCRPKPRDLVLSDIQYNSQVSPPTCSVTNRPAISFEKCQKLYFSLCYANQACAASLNSQRQRRQTNR